MKAIFVGGTPRSGTTMLGALLGGHSDVLCVPEAQFKWGMLERARSEPATSVESWVRRIAAHAQFRLWGLSLEDHPSVWDREQSNVRQAIEIAARAYGASVGKTSCHVWVDHCPRNVKYARLLLQEYPDAKLIHLVRDARAVAASVIPLDWGPNTVVSAAPWWLSQIAFGLAAEQEYPDRVLRVRYEDLVSSPAESLQRISNFVGLEFESSMLDGAGHTVVAYTKDQHKLVGRPADRSRAQAWKQTLSVGEVRYLEDATAGLLEFLGYDLVSTPATGKLRSSHVMRMRLVDEGRRWWNELYLNRRRNAKALRALETARRRTE